MCNFASYSKAEKLPELHLAKRRAASLAGLYEKTVYPRLAEAISADELTFHFIPTQEEIEFATRSARSAGSRLSLIVLLKLFQTLHRFHGPDKVPLAVINHLRIHPPGARPTGRTGARLGRRQQDLARRASALFTAILDCRQPGIVSAAPT
jgi:hypothetical protein